MKTTKPQAEAILHVIQKVVDARIRPMMGEYLLYINEKVAGQINHGDLYIKVTQFGETFAPELKKDPPYDGAKPSFVIPATKLEDQAWLEPFLSGTVAELPTPKK